MPGVELLYVYRCSICGVEQLERWNVTIGDRSSIPNPGAPRGWCAVDRLLICPKHKAMITVKPGADGENEHHYGLP